MKYKRRRTKPRKVFKVNSRKNKALLSSFKRILKYVLLVIVFIAGLFLLVTMILKLTQYYRFRGRKNLLKCGYIRKSVDSLKYLTGFVQVLDDKENVESMYIVAINKQDSLLSDEKKDIYILFLNKKDWIRVYDVPYRFTQVEVLQRSAKNLRGETADCWVYKQLLYNTGILPNFVIDIDTHFKILRSTLSIGASQDVIDLLRTQKSREHWDPLIDNKTILADGTTIHYVDFTSFYEQYAERFKIDKVMAEQAFVEIYNATEINGYATLWSRFLKVAGVEVSRIGTTDKELFYDIDPNKRVLLFTPKKGYNLTVEFIKSLFGEDNIVIVNTRPQGVLTTADIVIIIRNKVI